MANSLRTSNERQILRRCSIRAAIVGRPNAGKPSLLNQLLAATVTSSRPDCWHHARYHREDPVNICVFCR